MIKLLKNNIQPYKNSFCQSFILILCCVISTRSFSQDSTSTSTKDESPLIQFGWTKRVKEKSLEPYYNQLKTIEYGTQRFSIFEQLIEHHTKRNNTDSILHYGNLYVKEIGNWNETEKIKERHYARAYYFLGTGSFMNGLLDNSIKWHIKGLQAAENTNFIEQQYKNKLGLSKSYLGQSKMNKAIEILNQSLLDFAPEFPLLKVKNNILLGKAHRFNKSYEKASQYYDGALSISKALNDTEMLLTTRLELAKLAEDTNEGEKAFNAYESIRNEAKASGFDGIYFEGSLLLARYYYRREYYEAAQIGLSMAYVNAIESENLQFQKDLLHLQARGFAKQEDYKNAYAALTQLYGVLSQIKANQQREIIKELEIQYETLEKEKEISKLEENQIKKEAELSRQKTIKNAFLIGFLVILIPIIGLLYLYYQKIQTQSELAKKQEEINAQKVTALKQEQELNLIKATLDGQDEERKRIAQELHDSIGGNLAGIKLQIASINSIDLKPISNQLDETYQLVRDISHTLIPKKFREDNYIILLSEYVKNINNSNGIQVKLYSHQENELNTIDEKIKMEVFKVIQELMTNTLKHAKASEVDIQLNLIDENVSLLFEDNGIGFNTKEVSEGIGFKNIKHRVSELSGTLHIDSFKNKGTVIAIEIPV